jgi:hypothetical protein
MKKDPRFFEQSLLIHVFHKATLGITSTHAWCDKNWSDHRRPDAPHGETIIDDHRILGMRDFRRTQNAASRLPGSFQLRALILVPARPGHFGADRESGRAAWFAFSSTQHLVEGSCLRPTAVSKLCLGQAQEMSFFK